MRRRHPEEPKTKPFRPLIPAMLIFLGALAAAITILGAGFASDGELILRQEKEQAYLSVSSAAELLQNFILVEVDEKNHTEKYVRLQRDENGKYIATPRIDPEDPLGRGVFPEFLEGILTDVLEHGMAPYSAPFRERTLTITARAAERKPGDAALQAADRIGTVYAKFYVEEGDDPYSFFVKLYQGREENPAYSETLHFQGADMGAYSDAWDTRDVYWYETQVSR